MSYKSLYLGNLISMIILGKILKNSLFNLIISLRKGTGTRNNWYNQQGKPLRNSESISRHKRM